MRKKLILITTFTKMPECFTSREFYDELRMNGFEESWFEGDAIPKFLKDKCHHEYRGKTWEKITAKNVNAYDIKPKVEQQVIEYKQQELIVEKPVLNEKDCVNFLKNLGYKLFKTVEM